VTFHVVIPRKLTEEQRHILQKLAQTLPREQIGGNKDKDRDKERDDKGFFGRIFSGA
jgi:DnaJ-class molecular chaperone